MEFIITLESIFNSGNLSKGGLITLHSSGHFVPKYVSYSQLLKEKVINNRKGHKDSDRN